MIVAREQWLGGRLRELSNRELLKWIRDIGQERLPKSASRILLSSRALVSLLGLEPYRFS